MRGLKPIFQNGSHHCSIMPKLMTDLSEPSYMMCYCYELVNLLCSKTQCILQFDGLVLFKR